MNTSYLALSIDLDAEIFKITQKQYLNDVHYLVSLVRHALGCRPDSIQVTSTATSLEISHEGDPFPHEEWLLICRILAGDEVDWQAKQNAITRLEEQHGIAMLSLLVNASHTRIQSGTRSLSARRGRLAGEEGLPPRPGYRIQVQREALPKSELRELSFFCAGSAVPIYFNREKINRPIDFPEQMLSMRFSTPKGTGCVGIPRAGETCCLTFFKSGVRLGMRQFVPAAGFVYHGFWDSHLTEFESDYRQSLAQGEANLIHHARKLYQEVPAHFEAFNMEEKIRLKKLLMRESAAKWRQFYAQLAIFHSCRTPFALSLQHLLDLAAQFSSVPYCTKTNDHLPAYIPRLLPEDIFFLRREMGLNLKLAATPRRTRRRRSLPQAATDAPPTDANRHPLQQRFAEEAARDGLHRYYFRRGHSSAAVTRDGLTIVCLNEGDPRVQAALETFSRQPHTAGLLKYRLLALALGS